MIILPTKKHSPEPQQGFTLLEILLVVAAIAILAGIVIFAINPGKQLADTRNAQRRVDVNTILNAVHQYSINNQGNLPEEIEMGDAEICQTDASSCAGLIDLSELTENGIYIVSVPIDPQNESEDGTGYEISEDGNGRVTVSAPLAEQGETISATR